MGVTVDRLWRDHRFTIWATRDTMQVCNSSTLLDILAVDMSPDAVCEGFLPRRTLMVCSIPERHHIIGRGTEVVRLGGVFYQNIKGGLRTGQSYRS